MLWCDDIKKIVAMNKFNNVKQECENIIYNLNIEIFMFQDIR